MQSSSSEIISAWTPATALVVEGGAMRSVFSAGVLDEFIDSQFNPFQLYIGVSAAAFNLLTYLSGESGHGLRMFLKYALDRRFISFKRYLLGGHLLDLDWLVDGVVGESNEVFGKALKDARPIVVSITDVLSGEAKYEQLSMQNLKASLIATMALPQIYREFPLINNRPMTDGGVADSIPIARAIEMGAKHIMVIRSRHWDYIKKDTFAHKLIRWRLRNYTQLHKTLLRRASLHKAHMDLIRCPPHGIDVIEVCPPKHFTIGRFARHRQDLLQGYYAGKDMAKLAMAAWQKESRCKRV